jgi:hypothetical protein
LHGKILAFTSRVAARWLLRYLEEDPHATIEEAALAASCLSLVLGLRVASDTESL